MRPVQRVREALARIAESDRPEVWISMRDPGEALAAATNVEARLEAGENLPLAGLTVAVKDNIDHVAMATTAGCPAFSYQPAVTALSVARLEDAGAVVLGKTNLDQFATGLVGARSPYGAVRDVHRPRYVSGGSSSGSAVAVALGLVDLGVGTDTAGSGRVPAAFGGIVGVKGTRGLVPTDGVVPACRTLDCVTVFARELALAQRAIAVMASADPARAWSEDAPVGLPGRAPVAVPDQLPDLDEELLSRFRHVVERLCSSGRAIVEIDVAPFLEAAGLLYGGAFVAERYAAVGGFLGTDPEDVDPTVRSIILGARDVPAHALVRDAERLEELCAAGRRAMGDAPVLLLPTTTRQPTLAEVHADPVGVNSRLGVYTGFANLMDMCAVAVPAGWLPSGGEFGVQLLGWAFSDAAVGTLAAELMNLEPVAAAARLPAHGWLAPPSKEIFVVGAHRAGQPLNSQLRDRGAVLRRQTVTAARYQLFRLQTDLPKPGLNRPGLVGDFWPWKRGRSYADKSWCWAASEPAVFA